MNREVSQYLRMTSLLLILSVSSAKAQTDDSAGFVPDRPGFTTPSDIETQKAFERENGFQYKNILLAG